MFFLVVLYVHVLAALLLASTLAIEMVSLSRMRQAKNFAEARLWIDLVPRLPLMIAVSVIVLLLSGGYLTARMAAWTLAWPKVTVGAMVLIAPLGAATGRRMQGMRRMLAQGDGPAISERLNDRFLRLSLSLRSWIFAGIILLMTAKPGPEDFAHNHRRGRCVWFSQHSSRRQTAAPVTGGRCSGAYRYSSLA